MGCYYHENEATATIYQLTFFHVKEYLGNLNFSQFSGYRWIPLDHPMLNLVDGDRAIITRVTANLIIGSSRT